MAMRIHLLNEGFKLTRDAQGWHDPSAEPQLEELFTHQGGDACFQVALCGQERFSVSTGCRQWYSEKGHMERYRVAVSAQGAQVRLYIEGMMLDDDGALRADVLETRDSADYEADSVAAVYVQVTPEAAGDTVVTLRVYQSKGTYGETLIFERALPLKVYPVRLPQPRDYTFYLDLWQHPSNLARKHDVALWSEEHFAVIDRYAASMEQLGQKSITVIAGDVPWRGQGCIDNDRFPSDLFEYAMIRTIRRENGILEYDYSVMDRYISIYESHGILGDIEVLGLCNIWMKESFDDHPIVADDPEPYISLPCRDERTGALAYLDKTQQVDEFIAALEAHFAATGRLPRVRLAADEPADIPAYRRSIERIHRVAPRLRLKTAINHAEFVPAFADYIDDYMPSLQSASSQFDELERIRRELTGKRFLWYVCCAPEHPNTYLRSNLCETRLIGMLTRHIKFDGFLRWNYTVWPTDPRRDIRYGAFAAGDTNFVYPAANGSPLLTLRYMALRRAIQDFELMVQLDRMGKNELANRMCLRCIRIPDMRAWFDGETPQPLENLCSTDYRDYEEARLEMLEALSE